MIKLIKSYKKRELYSFIDEIISNNNLFYSDSQKIKYLQNIKHLCGVYGDKVTIGMSMNKFINEKLNKIKNFIN